MKITILTNYDAASSLALSYLLSELSKHDLTVFYTDKPAPLKHVSPALTKLAEFERSLSGLGQPFMACKAERLNNINQPDDMQRFTHSEPELVVSIRHMSILKAPVIATPKHGVINLHSGPLPAYRGVMATFWAMKNKETHIGTTLHTIDDASIDTGQVIANSREPARYDQSYLWNTLNLYKTGCANIVNTLNEMERNQRIATTKQREGGQYFSFPDTERIDQSGLTLFNDNDNLLSFLK